MQQAALVIKLYTVALFGFPLTNVFLSVMHSKGTGMSACKFLVNRTPLQSWLLPGCQPVCQKCSENPTSCNANICSKAMQTSCNENSHQGMVIWLAILTQKCVAKMIPDLFLVCFLSLAALFSIFPFYLFLDTNGFQLWTSTRVVSWRLTELSLFFSGLYLQVQKATCFLSFLGNQLYVHLGVRILSLFLEFIASF